jgi:hypothetical protein
MAKIKDLEFYLCMTTVIICLFSLPYLVYQLVLAVSKIDIMLIQFLNK